MNKVQMSLHRVMAEIKSIEEKLSKTPTLQFVSTVLGEPKDDVAKATRAQFIVTAKSNMDKTVSMIKNLAALKSARNQANAALKVTINGVEITIDEALAQKATLHHKSTLVDTLFGQVLQAQRAGLNAETAIETKIATQLQTMFGTRKATEEELKVVSDSVNRTGKPVVLAPEGLQTVLETMKNEITEFEKEIDYVLSEANATNKVEVSLV